MAMSCSWTIGHAERGSWEGDDGLMESTCTACETDAATMDVDGCGWMCFGIDHELVSVYVTVEWLRSWFACVAASRIHRIQANCARLLLVRPDGGELTRPT